MFSNLISEIYRAHTSNYTHNRGGYKICKFTPHHMAGKLTGKQCANIFRNPSRNASANYCIGYDGEIVGCVDEEFRAWTSSSRTNDFQAITVEVSNNCNSGPDWTISNASWNALVKLAVDVCKRHNFRLVYDGTPNGSLTRHNMFANTNCPGPYLQGRFEELVNVVNAKLDGKDINTSTDTSSTTNYTVKVTTDCLNIRKGPGTNFGIVGRITDKGTYTIVKESDGSGASKWGKLKSGVGWISLDYTNKNPGSSSGGYVSTYKLGLYVVNTPSGLNVRKGPGTNNAIIKTYRNGTRFDTYEISGDWARTPSGWVNLKYCSLVRAY